MTCEGHQAHTSPPRLEPSSNTVGSPRGHVDIPSYQSSGVQGASEAHKSPPIRAWHGLFELGAGNRAINDT